MAIAVSVSDRANAMIEEIRDMRSERTGIRDSKARIIEEAIIKLRKQEEGK